MIDDKKIEEVKESIFNKHFLNKNEDVVYIDHIAEPVYLDYQINKAIELGAKWAINEFLKDLWHDVDEMPKRAKSFIFECGDYSMNYHIGMMFNPNDYKKNAEIWHMNRWCYLEDILPKQEGGEK